MNEKDIEFWKEAFWEVWGDAAGTAEIAERRFEKLKNIRVAKIPPTNRGQRQSLKGLSNRLRATADRIDEILKTPGTPG